MYLFSYNQGSKSSKLLAEALDIPKIKHRNSNFRGSPDKVVINWGSSTLPNEVMRCRVVNRPDAVAIASNKLHSFNAFSRSPDVDDYVPSWTTDQGEAEAMLRNGHDMVARTILSGHSGNGIVIMEADDPTTWAVAAPLYVMYMKKRHEYRVHVVGREVIDVQRKGLAAEHANRDDINWRVRNLANGFIYARENVVIPARIRNLAINAVGSLGLDFGAVDIIQNERHDCWYVLEVNTAPGLMGTTLERYAAALRAYVENVEDFADIRPVGPAIRRPWGA